VADEAGSAAVQGVSTGWVSAACTIHSTKDHSKDCIGPSPLVSSYRGSSQHSWLNVCSGSEFQSVCPWSEIQHGGIIYSHLPGIFNYQQSTNPLGFQTVFAYC
jgi:hypothetical protein